LLEDTIIAVSTAPGYGGLGVVRLSGNEALAIAKKIYKPKQGSKNIRPFRPRLGYICNIESKETFETAYLTYFPAPQTYTKEDVIELSCHGSPVILEEVVRLGIKSGARHADPGEFTLRAYLNGRIDILQAEAIDDMIRAPSLTQAKISFSQTEGHLSKKIAALRKNLIHLLSQIEASIEFPDEGLKISVKSIAKTIDKSKHTVHNLIQSYDFGRTLAEGLILAITGRTNVGKSTLFNALLDKDRAIVTPYPGTTRDYLREQVKINDAVFTLVDMAGMDQKAPPIEKEGIERGQAIASEADGVLLLLDSSQEMTPEDLSLIQRYKNKRSLLLLNKIDLPRRMTVEDIRAKAPKAPLLEISALKKTNLDDVKKTIANTFIPQQDLTQDVILHLRQKLLLEDVKIALEKGAQLLEEGHSEDIYGEEIRKIIPIIGQLTGEIRSEDIMTDIFSRFCVGK
jgi:tRNA modification GTPase